MPDARRSLRPALIVMVLQILQTPVPAPASGPGPVPGDLITAARTGDTHAVHRLLQDPGTDPAAVDAWGYTALHWAAIRAHGDIAAELLDHGAPVVAIGGDGGSPLHWACHHDRPDIVGRMLDAGADPAQPNQWGRTPLHVAVRRGCLKAAVLLLDRGAPLQATTKEGWTPLHVARISGQTALADLLLAWGADPAARDADGRTPADLARTRPREWGAFSADPDDYVGAYDLEGGGHMLVWFADGALRLRDFADDTLYATGPDSFFCRREPWPVVFRRDGSGRVAGIEVAFLRRTVFGTKQDEPRYVGSAACRECHSGGEHGDPYVTWLQSRHAGAYWRLATGWAVFLAERRPQHRDITDPIAERRCLLCHHTAAQDSRALTTVDFTVTEGVGCEECHGPGSLYLDPEVMADRDAFLAAGGVIPGPDVCRRCHRNPEFDADAALAGFTHRLE